jgi:hypothetical protein
VGEKKYDATAVSMIALLRYGNGFPWHRLEILEASLGIPLPAGTQCDILMEAAAGLEFVLQELIRQGGARGGGTQRRYRDASTAIGAGCGYLRQADRSLHQRDREHLWRTSDRLVFHGVQTRGRKLGRGAEEAGGRVAAADPNVRWIVLQCAQAVRHIQDGAGEL